MKEKDKPKYILSPALERAVEIALHLNKPLLLTGEPGTGKTKLAGHLAREYFANGVPGCAPFLEEAYTFDTKTTSIATDLFYTYDALGRLRDIHSETKSGIGDYIELKALGRAMVNKHGRHAKALDKIRSIRDLKDSGEISEEPRSSIVLIDEIDKATRDFPNDILNEIDHMEFYIRELDAKISEADNNAKILVIMTSNNEKNLPDAFLRRCVFHYIDFPKEELLDDIVRAQLGLGERAKGNPVMGVIKTFNKIHELRLLKKPATAEFIDWMRQIKKDGLLEAAMEPYDKLPDDIRKQLNDSLSLLIKNYNDIAPAVEGIKKM